MQTISTQTNNPAWRDITEANRETERKEIEWLKTAPDKVFLYVNLPYTYWKDEYGWNGLVEIGTWLGTRLNEGPAYLGPSRGSGFGDWTSRRAVSCRIFGTLYHGWYMESSGDYCRLRKAKKQ